MLNLFKRIFKSGLTNFKRQFALNSATIFVLMVGLTLLTSAFFIDGLYNFLHESVQQKVGISVYFKLETSTDDILKLQQELKQRGDIKDVIYISKEEALQKFKDKHSYDDSILKTLEIIEGNPLPSSIRVIAKQDDSLIPGTANPYDEIAKFLKQDKYSPIIDQMSYYETESIIKSLINLTRDIKFMGLIVAIFFVLIVILMVFSTVRLTVRSFKEEIGVMKLVGASNWFVRGPFMVVGFVCGILAVLFSLILIGCVTYFSTPKIMAISSGFNPFMYFGNNFWKIFFMQLFAGVGIAIFANALAVKRYLKV
ncbi:MAG TPA: permease-like cell division protein FtsX [Candidatus Pacearchaeota archaeon]|nr:permease-like cell division protein FtsX [Candidatus Pacearchaeota archaeon]